MLIINIITYYCYFSLVYELVTDPEVIIIDEPTSGIDSFNSLIIMKYLKELANDGKLISNTKMK